MNPRIRVLLAKPGLDGHDRGLGVIARALRDSGMEVIYLGIHQLPEAIVRAALEEHVDVVALSLLSGAHMTLFPDVLKRLREVGLEDVLLIGGGIMPEDDKKELMRMGIGKLFEPGTPMKEIVDYITSWFQEKRLPKEPSPKVRKKTK